ncbi:MAG: DUF2179 domain-containing protein [Deltaproteobacteria bacterium]|nr:DUF2179 domain-containing protein [Deltaproteobacteria bacterium]
MDIFSYLDGNTYTWVVLPFLIFLARVMDVSLGTIRIIFISRDLKYLAPVIGFFEILIWLLAMREIMQNLNNPACFIAYALGFSSGIFVGMYIENRLSIGRVIIRIITKVEADELVNFLKTAGYGITAIDAHGATGPVKVVFSIVERHDIDSFVGIIKKFNPNAFYSIEDVRFVSESVFPFRTPVSRRRYLGMQGIFRKSK